MNIDYLLDQVWLICSHKQAFLSVNDALTKGGEGLTLIQRTAMIKAIREVK